MIMQIQQEYYIYFESFKDMENLPPELSGGYRNMNRDNPYERQISNRRKVSKTGPKTDILFLKPDQFLNSSLVENANQLWSYLDGM